MSLLISNMGERPEFNIGSSVRHAFNFRGCLIDIKHGRIWDADNGSSNVDNVYKTGGFGGSAFAAATMMPPCWFIYCTHGIFKDQPSVSGFNNDGPSPQQKKVELFLRKLKEQGKDLITVEGLSFTAKDGYQVYFDGHCCGVDVYIVPKRSR